MPAAGVVAKLGDRQAGPRTRSPLPQRSALNDRDGGGPGRNLQANLVPGLSGDALVAGIWSTPSPAWQQAASVDQLTGGGSPSDSAPVGVRPTSNSRGLDFATRGQRFDQQLHELQRAWAGEPLLAGTRPVGPATVQQPGVPLVIGGSVDASIRRVVEFGIGWTAGGMPPDAVGAMADRMQTAWKEAGRDGRARVIALTYFSLGDTVEASRGYLLDYYAPMGDATADMIAGQRHRSRDAIAGAVEAYAAAGVDELILDPTVADPEQVDLAADVVLGS